MSPERPEGDAALGRRLRGLPPPPVPADLETRLLAAMPRRGRGGSSRFWLATTVLLAAAASALIAFRLPPIAESPSVRVAAAPPALPPTLWTYEQALRRPGADAAAALDRAAPFVWPVEGSRTPFLSSGERGASAP